MLRYLIRRLFVMVPTLIAISILIFVIIQAPPGSYLDTYMAELQSQVRPGVEVLQVVDVQPLSVEVEERASRARIVREQPRGLSLHSLYRSQLPRLGRHS